MGMTRPPAIAGAEDSKIAVENAIDAANFNMT
ncbi:hypothetical protein SPHINGOR109_51241 [Sphingorhabdus sp. 109]|nr:hypothetical protein SPHINGOR109_51241 [Sphingorhabdus sp. 109]